MRRARALFERAARVYRSTHSLRAPKSSRAAAAFALAAPSVALIEESNVYSIGDEVAAVANRVRTVCSAAGDRVRRAANDPDERPVLGLMVANVAVHVLWRTMPLRVMARHFMSTVDALRAGRVHTLITANFSHADLFHLSGNMLMLGLIGPGVVYDMRSSGRFLEMYITAGIAGMGASTAWKAIVGRRYDGTIGASGAVLGLFGCTIALRPDDNIEIFGISMNRREFLGLVCATDIVVAMVLRNIALMGHFGGIAAGVGYTMAIKDRLVEEVQFTQGWRSVLSKEPDAPLLSALIWRRYVVPDESRK